MFTREWPASFVSLCSLSIQFRERAQASKRSDGVSLRNAKRVCSLEITRHLHGQSSFLLSNPCCWRYDAMAPVDYGHRLEEPDSFELFLPTNSLTSLHHDKRISETQGSQTNSGYFLVLPKVRKIAKPRRHCVECPARRVPILV